MGGFFKWVYTWEHRGGSPEWVKAFVTASLFFAVGLWLFLCILVGSFFPFFGWLLFTAPFFAGMNACFKLYNETLTPTKGDE